MGLRGVGGRGNHVAEPVAPTNPDTGGPQTRPGSEGHHEPGGGAGAVRPGLRDTPMPTLLAVSDRLAAFVSVIGRLAAWLTIALMCVIIFDVVTRRFVALGSTRLQELEWHLHGALFLLCFGFAYVRDAHVRIELIREGWSSRTRAWVEIVGIVLCLIPYSLLVMKFGWDFTARSFRLGEGSMGGTGLPHRFIIKSLLPIGFALVAVGGISVLLRCIVALYGPPVLRQRAEKYLVPPPLSGEREGLHGYQTDTRS